MKRLSICLLPVLLLITSSSHGLRVYKWHGPDGVQYSDRPPPSMAEDPTQVRINSDANGKEPVKQPAQTGLENTRTLNGETTTAANGPVVDNSLQTSGSGSPIGGGGGGGSGGGSQASSEGGDVGVASAESESGISPAPSAPLSSGGDGIVAAATLSTNGGNAPASESGFSGLAVGAVATGNTSSGSSVGSGQSTSNGGQVAVFSGDKPSTQEQAQIKSPAPPKSGSEGVGSTSEPVDVATIETLTTANNNPSAPEPQSEPGLKEVVQVETIVVAGSAAISSPESAPSVGGPSAGASRYYNSDEPGCDGNDSTVLFCDDFEDGSWGETNCDTAGGQQNPDNDGWCLNIYKPWPDSKGSSYARCGGLGVARTDCAATSDVIKVTSGMTGGHTFAPDNRSYDEVWVRWYLKERPGFIPGHEKILFISERHGPWFLILSKYFGSGNLTMISRKEDKWMGQNQGNKLTIVPGRWYYIEVHIKLNDPGLKNAIYELWMDDCGTDGLGCRGPGTLRARHTNREFRTSPGQKIGLARLTNWSNPISQGEEYYDQVYVATRRVGPM